MWPTRRSCSAPVACCRSSRQWRQRRAGASRSVRRHNLFTRLLAAALALARAGCTTIVGQFVLPKEGVREASNAVNRQKGVAFNPSDGIALVADVYRPRTE